MKRFYLLTVLGFVFLQHSIGQIPTTERKGRADTIENAKKKGGPGGSIPDRIGWTNDFVQLFSKAEILGLDSLIGAYEKRTSVEIAVATIDSSMMGHLDLDSYTLLMLRTWRVGKEGKNNGMLIAIAPGMRKIRIQNGYGIEKILTDEQTKEIIDMIILPHFKNGQFYQGTREGILAIMTRLDKEGLQK